MSAGSQSGRLSAPVHKLGIIAGSGRLPELLLESCARRNIEPFIIAIKGQTDPALYAGRDHLPVRLGAAGAMVAGLRARGIRDLVMIGAIRRPGLLDLRPDFYAARFLTKVSFSALGDDGLLRAIRGQLEKDGFCLHGVQDFIDDIVMPEGLIGGPPPGEGALRDIRIGLEASKALGERDKGQSVLVLDGVVIGEEGPAGTNALIAGQGRRGAVLVKSCKPQQDRDIDLPTIGPDTLNVAMRAGLAGIALEAGAGFLVDRDEVAAQAAAHGIFVVGIRGDA